MDDRDSRSFSEELLDRALARHGAAEVQPGLEQRVLARLEAGWRPAPWRFVSWKLAAGLAAAGIILVFVAHRVLKERRPAADARRDTIVLRQGPGTVAPAKPAERTTAPAVPRTSMRRGGTRRASQVARSQRSTSRPAVFPTPAPLSDEEKALVSYAKLARAQGLPAFSFDERREPDRIEIAPLVIEPMKNNSPWE